MRKITLLASVSLAFVLPAVASPKHTATAKPVTHRHRPCDRLFTVRMGKRAARAIYRGTRRVTMRNLKLLGYIERCQDNRAAQWYVRWYDRREDGRHKARIEARRQARYEARLRSRMSYGVASWYNDGGSTASGYHAYYGAAVCGSGGGPCVPFGTHITFYYHGRQVTAIADDHGPYVAGRSFDLNQNTAAALGFGGVDTVGYAIG